MPRILFCCPHAKTKRLGASKVYLEIAEGFRDLDWEVDLIGPEDLGSTGQPNSSHQYAPLLKDYLRSNAAKYDVIEYEHTHLPYARSFFDDRPLFVARSVLLHHCVRNANIQTLPKLKNRLSHLIKKNSRERRSLTVLNQANETLRYADLVNVPNTDDKEVLINAGHSPDKIAVIPFGLTKHRLSQFTPAECPSSLNPIIAFVGSFDPRKGLREFPEIVQRIVQQKPDLRFRLIGTAGLVPDESGVLSYFPGHLRKFIEVKPRFDPDELPELLRPCSLGVFPSHVEGFPFGVLEMLAAGLPVCAYRTPGAPMMLNSDFLSAKGDGAALATNLLRLLNDHSYLNEARTWARARATEFNWDSIIKQTSELYLARARQNSQ